MRYLSELGNKARDIIRKTKGIIAIVSGCIIIGFIVGFIITFIHITEQHYIQYKTFRLAIVTLQKNLNSNILYFTIGILALNTIRFLLNKKAKQDKDRVIKFNILSIVILSTTRSIDLLSRKLVGRTLLAASIKFVAKVGEFLNGRSSFNVFLQTYKVAIVILVSSSIVALILCWLFTKVRLKKIPIIVKGKYIIRTALTLVTILAVLNLYIATDSKINIPKGPNVILVIVDTLRADHLSCYGYNKNTSPNIDKLSADSLLFKHAISATPWTDPSIGSIFTSQYPAVLGFENEHVKINNKFLTLAEILKENNYLTKGIISHVLVSSALNFNQGFDSYDEKNAKGFGQISSPSITKKAVSFLKEHKNNKFFLFLHYFDPHYDYILHEKYNYYSDYDGPLYSGESIFKLREKAPEMLESDIKYVKSLYDSEISFTDEYIGKFLDELKQLGLYNDTLIIFTADHGEEFCERGDYWIGHTKKLYQEQIHVPLIIKLPGKNKRKIIDEYVGLINLMPTIINYVGLKIPDEYEHEGETINLNDIKKLKHKEIISETKKWVKLQSVTKDGWKFVYNLDNNFGELFNLKKDPAESKNIAFENKETLKEMETILQKWSNYIKLKKLKVKVKLPAFTEEQKKHLKSLGYIK